ncbi:MAG TPA: hypothetical protein VIX14_12910 [Terriglobales bacterium]
MKASKSLGVLGYIIGQELEGYEAMQLYVLSLVDDTHSSHRESVYDAVMGNGLSDHE